MTRAEKKKILYIVTKSNFGGAQRYVYDLATGLSRDKWEIVVAAGGSGRLFEKLRAAHIPVVSIPRLDRAIHPLKEFSVFFSLYALYRKERPAVIHLNSSKIGGLGALAGRLYNITPKGNPFKKENYRQKARIVFTAHGWAWNEPRGIFARAFIFLLAWLTMLLCHRIITVAEKERGGAAKFPFVKRKIVTVLNGINASGLIPRERARELILGKSTLAHIRDAFWVGTVAELVKNKGISYGIEAVGELSKQPPGEDIFYVIIGDGEEKYALYNQAKKERIGEHVHLVGSQDDAAALLPAFDLFLLPSIKEGLPYVLLEAGIAGIPVVATDVGGVSEIITDRKEGLLVRPGDSDEIARALFLLYKNKEMRDSMAEALQKKVRKIFSLDRMRADTYAHYNA